MINVLNRRFKVRADYSTLHWLLNPKKYIKQVTLSLAKFDTYDFKIVRQAEKKNANATEL